ncbi:MAG: MalY/PatB family protein [Acidimicrobiales bacterium]
MTTALDPRFTDLDLDTLRRRRGTKWARYGPEVLPAWVADMDFPLAEPIRRTILDALAHDDLGYPLAGAAGRLASAYAAWRPDAVVEPAWAHLLPDVIKGLEAVIEVCTAPGDAVVVQTPVYPPFLKTVANLGRRVVENRLTADRRVDLDDLARVCAAERPPLLLLCHPHNPCGRAFDDDELRGIARVCAEHDVFVASDEIHADLVFAPHHHRPFSALGPDAAARTITLTSSSKAFNIAGLRCAFALAGSEVLHQRLAERGRRSHDTAGSLGIDATIAAWSPEGRAWLDTCMAVLDHNRHLLASLLDGSGIGYSLPEATYLAWLDCRSLGLDDDPAAWFLDHARVALSIGPDFGPPGVGHTRLNLATSPTILTLVVDRMRQALDRR